MKLDARISSVFHLCPPLVLAALLLLGAIREVASCSYYNEETYKFEHWSCPSKTNCCIYYGRQSCCAAKEPYMSNGEGPNRTHIPTGEESWNELKEFFEENYDKVMMVMAVLLAVALLVLCYLQWQKRTTEEEEEQEILRISQLIGEQDNPCNHCSTGASPHTMLSSMYNPQPRSSGPQHALHTCNEHTQISAQQPPSYESIVKDTPPPPPYVP